MKVPFPPFNDRPINPYSKINNGTNYGVCKPNGCSFAHSMVGTLSGTDAWFRRRDVASLTPWGIGCASDGALDGVIYRWMDYRAFTDVQPWSSGPANYPYYGDGPAFIGKYGIAGVNGFAQAIELSDGGNIHNPVSPKQWKSFIWLSAAIAHDGNITSEIYRDKLAFMHHREITTPSYKDCPFPRVYNFTDEYIDAILRLMRFFEGKTDNLNTLVVKVAGITLDFRDVGRMRDKAIPAPKPTVPTGPIFYNLDPNPTLIVGKGGATLRQYAGRASKILANLSPGTPVEVDGYYIGETVSGSNIWYVQNKDPRGRIHISGFKEGHK